jgi:hypothetical protein
VARARESSGVVATGGDAVPSPRTIDVHAHARGPKVGEIVEAVPGAPAMESTPRNRHLDATRYRPSFTDINVRLQTMDRQRIDMQVVSPAPNDSAFGYWADWAAAQDLGAVLFIHPPGNTLGGRIARYYLIDLIGNPLDTTMLICSLTSSASV